MAAYISLPTSAIAGSDIIKAPPATLPTVTTSAVSDITPTTAESGGIITSDGGATITVRGICWDTSANPTTADNKTSDGTGTGSFDSNLTGLDPNTTYYVRAYATNSEGTSYGNEITFKTASTIPRLTTTAISNVTTASAVSGGNITSHGGSSVTLRGVCWSTTPGPTVAYDRTQDGSGTGSFASNMTDLNPNTTYYVRAYAANSDGVAYGNEISFSTATTTATVTTDDASIITATGATSGGNVVSDGGNVVTARGVCWSTAADPTIADGHTTDGIGIGSFMSTITGLNPGTTYHARAYATNSAGTSYGQDRTFTTAAATTPPTVTTADAFSITTTTAGAGGDVTSNGGLSVTARGICWSASPNPTIADDHTTDGTGTGIFASNLTGLDPNTSYHIRAYATNSDGTAYGDDLTFTTAPAPTPPTVTTESASNISLSQATAGGNVTSDGNASVTARGVCWSASANPTTADSHTTDGAGTGVFTSSITGLTAAATYHLRAYATNSQGTAYGQDRAFTTSAAPSATTPTVTTTAVSSITTTTATGGGNVTSDGNASVTARGVCWSVSANPTTADSRTTDGSGTGVFTSSITGLTAAATYHARAYATNSAGTAYGADVSFTAAADANAPLLRLTTATDDASGAFAVGEEIAFSVFVENIGGGALTDLIVAIPISDIGEFVSMRVLLRPGTEIDPDDLSITDGMITLRIGQVPPGTNVLIELVLRALASGRISLTASALSDETPDPTTASTPATADVEDIYDVIVSTPNDTSLCGLVNITPLISLCAMIGIKASHRRRGNLGVAANREPCRRPDLAHNQNRTAGR